MSNIVKFNNVEEFIIEIRGEKVILDSNVASLYGVETMRINEAVKNNPDKFPEGYIFTLTKAEKIKVIENFDNPKLKYSNAGVAKRVRCEAARVAAKEMSSNKQVSQQTRHDQNDTPSKSRRDRDWKERKYP